MSFVEREITLILLFIIARHEKKKRPAFLNQNPLFYVLSVIEARLREI